ncbi:MAG: FAD:protein FMN transferase [Clostridia bacterium]|nr:FAD:protein FMN transferase [Clostridia bacterium]
MLQLTRMKKLWIFISLIFILVLSLPLFACKNQGSSISFSCFNTSVYIQTQDKTVDNKTETKLKTVFSNLDDEFSATKENSFTSRFNALKVGESISITQTEKTVIKLCKDYFEFTSGKFSPALRRLTELWGFDDKWKIFTPPEDQQIQELLGDLTDFNGVVLDEQNNKVQKVKDVKLDFGGVLKGYACQLALDILKDAGVKKGYVNVGSSSLSIMNAKELGVRHPRANDDTPLILTVKTARLVNVGVSTSGDYENKRSFNGKTYSHIIDPNTGKPSETGVASATLICSDPTFSDAVTTALCLETHTPDDVENSPLVALMKKIENRFNDAFLFVCYIDGNVKQLITNKKQGENFTLHDTDFSVVNI